MSENLEYVPVTSNADKKVEMVVPVHLYGNCGDMADGDWITTTETAVDCLKCLFRASTTLTSSPTALSWPWALTDKQLRLVHGA